MQCRFARPWALFLVVPTLDTDRAAACQAYWNNKEQRDALPARDIFGLSSPKIDQISRAGIFTSQKAEHWAMFPFGKMPKRTLTTVEIGEIIRSTRKSQKLRQDELAGAAGVGVRFIVDLEAGKPTAQIGKALQILDALGCSLQITPPAEPKK